MQKTFTSVRHKPARATDLWFSDHKLFILLNDGREIGVPLVWFPTLRSASAEDLQQWRHGG